MNIVIVGGGTAGWLAAFGIAKALNHKHKITIVESSQIGIIGAGEGSTGILTDFLKGTFFPSEINLQEFIEETDATIKLGIHHINWRGDNTSYFGPLGLTPTGTQLPDKILLEMLANNPTKSHTVTLQGYAFEYNHRAKYGAFQFDAFKVGEYLKKICSKHPNTSIVDATVKDVILDELGNIKELITDAGNISGDFFIDCSGLKRILMDKLNVPWHSYKKNLPVDSALPFQIPIEENYDQVTTALALKHGWMWKIPTRERYGCGYVYDSEHITPEQAQQEVEELLGHEIAPIRNIKFDAGRGEKMWEKNCMSLGLATAFSEPLEATSIHTTVAQLVMFIFEYLQDTKESTVIESRIDQFNKQMITMYDEIKDFLVLHYQGGRIDTEFWKRIASGETMSDRAEWILNMCKHGAIPSINTFGKNYLGMIGPTLHNWTLAGLGHITPEHARAQLEKFNVATQAKYETEGLLGHLHHNIARILEMS